MPVATREGHDADEYCGCHDAGGQHLLGDQELGGAEDSQRHPRLPRRSTPGHQEFVEDEQEQRRDPGRGEVQVQGRMRGDVGREGVDRAADHRAETVTGPAADREPGGEAAEGDADDHEDVESEDGAADLRREPAEEPEQRHRGVPHEIHAVGRTDLAREKRIEAIGQRVRRPAEVPDCLVLVTAASGPAGGRVAPGADREDDGAE